METALRQHGERRASDSAVVSQAKDVELVPGSVGKCSAFDGAGSVLRLSSRCVAMSLSRVFV